MELTTTFYIIFLLLFLILLFAILLYASVRKTMARQHKEVLGQQGKYLTEFWEKLSDGLRVYEAEFNKSTVKITNSIIDTERTHMQIKEKQQKEFTDLTNTIRTDYKAYLTEIKKLNDYFDALTLGVKESKDNYDKILPVLQENYQKLELISDKGKEIVSDHEKTLWEHNNKLDTTLKKLTEGFEDEVTDLKTQTEVSLNEELKKASGYISSMTEKAETIFKEVSEKTAKQIEDIASAGEKQLKELSESDLANVGEKVDGLSSRIQKMTTEHNNKVLAIQMTMKNLIADLEKKMENSKRKLF